LDYILQETAMANATLKNFQKCTKMDGNLTLCSDRPRIKPKRKNKTWITSSKQQPWQMQHCREFKLSKDGWEPGKLRQFKNQSQKKNTWITSSKQQPWQMQHCRDFKLPKEGWEPGNLRPSKNQTPDKNANATVPRIQNCPKIDGSQACSGRPRTKPRKE
jgi:hypothetical protein